MPRAAKGCTLGTVLRQFLSFLSFLSFFFFFFFCSSAVSPACPALGDCGGADDAPCSSASRACFSRAALASHGALAAASSNFHRLPTSPMISFGRSCFSEELVSLSPAMKSWYEVRVRVETLRLSACAQRGWEGCA